MPLINKKFGAALKAKRNEQALTQTTFAAMVGLSLRQVMYYEAGHVPPYNKVKQLNEFFGFDFNAFIYEDRKLKKALRLIAALKKENELLKLQLKRYAHKKVIA